MVPPGAVWPLPAYELALMTAGEAKAMGHDDVKVTVVTPEREPLTLFGERAAAAVAEELRWAGVDLVAGAVASPQWRRPRAGALRRAPRRRARVRGAADRRPGAGRPRVRRGGLHRHARGRPCARRRHTWAAGDGIASPIKFGGVATQQARVAVAGIAREAGLFAPEPGEPVVHGRLLVGQRTRRLRGDAEGAPLWWPHGKIAGEYLPRWLAEHGIVVTDDVRADARGSSCIARCGHSARRSTSTCSSSGASTGRG